MNLYEHYINHLIHLYSNKLLLFKVTETNLQPHTRPHSGAKPYTFHISALQQKHSLLLAAVEKKETPTNGEPANQNLRRFRFFTSSAAIGPRRPQRPPPPWGDWSVFPALWKSFEYASLWGSLRRCWFKLTQPAVAGTQWRRARCGHTADRLVWVFHRAAVTGTEITKSLG